MADLAGIAKRFNLSPDRISRLGEIEQRANELSSRIGTSRPMTNAPVKKRKNRVVAGKPTPKGPSAVEALSGSKFSKEF